MALPVNSLPYGLRDVKLTPIDPSTGAYGVMVDLPASRTLTWAESEDFEQLRGDDIVQAERGNGPVGSWDLEQGGISLAAYAVISGGTTGEAGISPNIIRTFSKTGLQARPYFRVDGQAINDNGGDTHVILYRCKSTGDIGGEFTDGAFTVTKCSGSFYPDQNHASKLYDVIANETVTSIIQPV